MNRLTQKIKDTYLTETDNACLDYCEQARTYIGGNVLNKLGQLEDIEEELGINLITLFKALNQFYAKDLDCYCPRPTILFKSVKNEWFIKWINNYYKLKDYGKTWALTREELE